jgi:succinyl-CoA synthetase alpha subunit
MSILLDRATRVCLQGITGPMGRFQAEEMRRYGTNLVAGVSPGRGGENVAGIPVFDTMERATRATGAEMTIMFVAAARLKDALFEAIAAGIRMIVCVAEFVPVHDMVVIKRRVSDAGVRLIGPNCSGIITPGEAKVGFYCAEVAVPGDIGLIAKSGTLSYITLLEMKRRGLGTSTIVGIGGDEIKGMDFADCLELFDADPATRAVVMVGEVGGRDEEIAADHIRRRGRKPVVALIAGRTIPPGRAIGHAGAFIIGSKGTHASKVTALRDAGVRVAETVEQIPELLIS